MQDGAPHGEKAENSGSAGENAPDGGEGNATAPAGKTPERERRKGYMITAFVAAAAKMGIDLTGASGHGTSAVSYAVPIDEALTVARQLRH